jgi:hypothetical protein
VGGGGGGHQINMPQALIIRLVSLENRAGWFNDSLLNIAAIVIHEYLIIKAKYHNARIVWMLSV